MGETVAILSDNAFISGILTEEVQFPEFMLPNSVGRMISLSGLPARGPVIVQFFRGEWCPYCRLMLDALVTVLPEIEALGAPLIALTPDTGPAPHDAKTNHGAAFDVLSDVDCGAVFAPGGVFRVSPLYKTLLITVGLDMPRRHGDEAWFLLIPAVLIGRDQGRWVAMGLEEQVDEQRLDGFRIVADRVILC